VNKFNQATQRQEPVADHQARPAKAKPFKFTMLLSDEVLDALQDDEQRLRKEIAVVPTRSQIVRILLERLHHDELLFDEVARRYVEMENERRTKEAVRRSGGVTP
jgi:hypothetical protein